MGWVGIWEGQQQALKPDWRRAVMGMCEECACGGGAWVCAVGVCEGSVSLGLFVLSERVVHCPMTLPCVASLSVS